MAARISYLIAFIGILLSVAASAQQGNLPKSEEELYEACRIRGKVFSDRRPVERRIEVRLERLDSSLVAVGYTSGSFDFEIFFLPFVPTEHYFLVIREAGFKELRYELDSSSFRLSFTGANRKTWQYDAVIWLELESLDPQDKLAASKVVTIKKIPSDIPEEAIKEYDQAIDDFNSSDSLAALAHLEKAVTLAPKYYDAVSKLGAEYLKAGQYEKAEALLNQARTLDPKDPGLLTNLGTLYVKQGEALAATADADPAYDLDLEADASKPGTVYFRKAVEVLEEAAKLDPQSARANFYLGTALYHIAEYDRAESYLLNSLAAEKPIQDARLTLLNIYKLQKRYDAALLQIEVYLAANPDSPQREQLEKFRTQIKDDSNRN